VNFADKQLGVIDPAGNPVDLISSDGASVSTDAGNTTVLGTDGGVYTPVPRIIDVSDSSPGLRITQRGAGNALLVEDSTNPDATPFVITDVGTIISGHTLPIDTDGYTGLPTSVRLQLHGVSSTASTLGNTLWNNSGSPVQMIMSKSRSAAIGAYSPVQSGDGLGALVFAGDDGSAFVTAASIIGMSDGTPGTSDMPGRLVFATTADGASAPSERMRIASDGKVGIGTNAAGARLHVAENAATPAIIITQTGAGDALVVEDSTSPDATPTIITQAGQIVSGHTTTVNTDNSYGGQITPRVQTHGTITDNAALGATLWTGSGAGSQVALSKSRGATIGTRVIVQSGDDLGAVAFNGDDGASFIVAAAISAAVDGTPGTNDMPGRLVLSTTADGAAVPTERLRINSSGAIGLGGANFGTDGQVLTSKGAALPPVWASTNSHTHTASQITDFSEAVDDRVGVLVKAGNGVSVAYDDTAGTLTVSSTMTGVGLVDGDKGDITVSGTGTAWAIDANAVTNLKLADMPALTIKGNNTAAAADPRDLTTAQVQTMLGITPSEGAAPTFASRAWVNFDGIGTVTIRKAANCSSVLDDGVGEYTVNFTVAMPDANYCIAASQASALTNSSNVAVIAPRAASTAFSAQSALLPGSVQLRNRTSSGNEVDVDPALIVIFR
jgi:hypothetical protein